MNDIKAVFGDALLNYMFASEVSDLSEQDLTVAQRGILEILRGWIQQLAGQPAFEQRSNLVDALLKYVPASGTTFANAARLACGGLIPDGHTSSDPTLNSLLVLGRDTYPGFLLAPVEQPISLLGAALIQHPQVAAFCKAALADESLKNLFPGVAKPHELTTIGQLISVKSELIFPWGHGRSFQLVMLPDCLLSAAYYTTLLAGESTLETYLSTLEGLLQDVRKLANGEACEARVIFWLSNIHIPSGTSIRTPWGTLSSSDRIDDALVPSASKATALLLTMRPITILHIAPHNAQTAGPTAFANFEGYIPQMDLWARETDRVIDLARLAFLLASPDDSFYVPQYVYRTVISPIEYVSPIDWRRTEPRVTSSPAATLDQAGLERVENWIHKTKQHPKRLDIAMRRSVSALAQRTDPLDGFIDAVLAWENMFSGRPETNLRVCGAIAWLLRSDDYLQREELFKELKDLYTKRSKLVHGAMGTIPDATACRDRAVRIAVDSMKRLYANSALLRMESSDTRGAAILLGATQKAHLDTTNPGNSR